MYSQFMMHGQKNIKSVLVSSVGSFFSYVPTLFEKCYHY